MRNSTKLGAAAVAGVLSIGSLGAMTAFGENLVDDQGPSASVLAERAGPRDAALAREAEYTATIEYAGALHEDRVEDYALLVYVDRVEKAEAARAAAAAAEAAAAATAASANYSGGAGGDLAAIRACESGGNYGAVSPDGNYRGAYQFDYQTWQSVGGQGDPATASPSEQDARAQALRDQRGSNPWPVCG